MKMNFQYHQGLEYNYCNIVFLFLFSILVIFCHIFVSQDVIYASNIHTRTHNKVIRNLSKKGFLFNVKDQTEMLMFV